MKIGIAGAGIMGRLLAWQLAEQGHSITLFDKDPIEYGTAAAYTAAGMLTPYCEVESAELSVYQMGMQSLALWPAMIKQWNSDVGYQQLGSLVVAHQPDRSDHQRFNQQVLSKLSPSAQQFQTLDRHGIHSLEPELSARFSEATYLPEEAWLCTKCVMKTLADLLLERRIAWYSSCTVSEITAHSIIANGDNYSFDLAIDCRGLGAKKDFPTLRGVRGELIWLDAPEVSINRLVRLMHPRYRLYVVPQKDNRYVIGATQIESNDDGPITVRSTLELLSAAYSISDGFAEARVLETKTNCRPALSDNLPKIKTSDGLIRINGLYRHGFLLAPLLAQEVLNHINDEGAYQSNFAELFQQAA